MNEVVQNFFGRRFPTVLGAIHWLASPRMRRRYVFVVVCVATLVALFYTEENWRGRHAWENYVRQSKAEGVVLDFNACLPPPVPDDQNFGALPLFKSLFDYKWGPDGRVHWPDTNWVERDGAFSMDLSYEHLPEEGSWEEGQSINLKEWQVYFRGTNFPANDKPPAQMVKKFGLHHTVVFPMTPVPQTPAADILTALGKFDGGLAELRQASARPFCRFPLHYDELPQTLLVHLLVLRRVCNILQLRAIAELALSRPDNALADVRLSFYCANALKSEPWMMSQFVRSWIIKENLQPIWEGLRAHQWPARELEEIQPLLSETDLLPDYVRVRQANIAFVAAWIEHIPDVPEWFTSGDEQPHVIYPNFVLSSFPRGWYCQNELAAARFYREEMLDDVLPEMQQAFPQRSLTNAERFEAMPATLDTFAFKRVGTVYSPQNVIQAQTGLNLARMACALERCRMARGQFPDKLESLAPDYMDKLPHDIIGGGPLKYRLQNDGEFVLYSIGWNEMDDGGAYPKTGEALRSSSHGQRSSFKEFQPETGDWVWRYPETNSASASQ